MLPTGTVSYFIPAAPLGCAHSLILGLGQQGSGGPHGLVPSQGFASFSTGDKIPQHNMYDVRKVLTLNVKNVNYVNAKS